MWLLHYQMTTNRPHVDVFQRVNMKYPIWASLNGGISNMLKILQDFMDGQKRFTKFTWIILVSEWNLEPQRNNSMSTSHYTKLYHNCKRQDSVLTFELKWYSFNNVWMGSRKIQIFDILCVDLVIKTFWNSKIPATPK